MGWFGRKSEPEEEELGPMIAIESDEDARAFVEWMGREREKMGKKSYTYEQCLEGDTDFVREDEEQPRGFWGRLFG